MHTITKHISQPPLHKLIDLGLTALSTQIGYIVPLKKSMLQLKM